MSDRPNEEMKKKLQAQKLAAEEEAVLKQQAALKQSQVDASILNEIAQEEIKEEEPASIKPVAPPAILNQLIEAYNKKKPPYPGIEDDVMRFPSLKEAENFFEEQAKTNIPFVCRQVDENKKPSGFYMLSCATGHLFKGNGEQVKKELEEHIAKAQKETTPNPSIIDKLQAGLQAINQEISLAAGPKFQLGSLPSSTKPALADMKTQQGKQTEQEPSNNNDLKTDLDNTSTNAL